MQRNRRLHLFTHQNPLGRARVAALQSSSISIRAGLGGGWVSARA